MKPRLLSRLLLLASLLLAGCGVPISAANLALTPDATATPDDLGVTQFAVSSSGPASTDPAVRALGSSSGLTPRSSSTPASTRTPGPTGTAGPSSTPTLTPTATRTATATPFGTPPPTATPTPVTPDIVTEALNILNKYRTDSGRAVLHLDPKLSAAAATYAKYMADNNWFYCGCDFHTGPDGSQPDQRVARAGYTGSWKGEAIAGGQSTAQAVISTWLNSPPHAAIVLDVNAIDVGIGYYYKAGDNFGHYWVLTTGVP